jgi:hypothetical protein
MRTSSPPARGGTAIERPLPVAEPSSAAKNVQLLNCDATTTYASPKPLSPLTKGEPEGVLPSDDACANPLSPPES